MIKSLKLSKFWDSLRYSYWFVPSVMSAAAIALAFGLITLDRALTTSLTGQLGWVYTGGPDGARSLLSAIAGSMVTVAGTVFSITIVALQLASSQFGPRILRNFMQDTGNQFVLGTFVSTFIYCLLILRTVRGEDSGGEEFVPQLAVTASIALAITNTGILIYFIHHASTLIQASHVIKQVATDLDSAIDRLFPEKLGQKLSTERRVGEIPVDFEARFRSIKSEHSGYLQAVNVEKLMDLASHHQLLLYLNYHPGHFVVRGNELIRAYPGERVDSKLAAQINRVFLLGRERTEQQDVEFPIQQLVEIAIRAISPSINDPFTAIRCIDQLAVGLCTLAEREFPSPYRYDSENHLRVIARPYTFAELTDAAFNQIRQYGKSDVAVAIRLLEVIAVIATHTHRQQDRSVLLRHATMIHRDSLAAISEACDCTDLEERYQAATQALKRHQDD